MDLMLNVIWTN